MVLKIIYVLMCVVITYVWLFVQYHPDVYLEFVYFTSYML